LKYNVILEVFIIYIIAVPYISNYGFALRFAYCGVCMYKVVNLGRQDQEMCMKM